MGKRIIRIFGVLLLAVLFSISYASAEGDLSISIRPLEDALIDSYTIGDSALLSIKIENTSMGQRGITLEEALYQPDIPAFPKISQVIVPPDGTIVLPASWELEVYETTPPGRYSYSVKVIENGETIALDSFEFFVYGTLDTFDYIRLRLCYDAQCNEKGDLFTPGDSPIYLKAYSPEEAEFTGLLNMPDGSIRDLIFTGDKAQISFNAIGTYTAAVTASKEDYESYATTIEFRVRLSEPVIIDSRSQEQIPVESTIFNAGPTELTGYLIMKIQKQVDGEWQDYREIVNEFAANNPRTINPNEKLNLADIFNSKNYMAEEGSFRLNAEFVDGTGEVIKTKTGYLSEFAYFSAFPSTLSSSTILKQEWVSETSYKVDVEGTDGTEGYTEIESAREPKAVIIDGRTLEKGREWFYEDGKIKIYYEHSKREIVIEFGEEEEPEPVFDWRYLLVAIMVVVVLILFFVAIHYLFPKEPTPY